MGDKGLGGDEGGVLSGLSDALSGGDLTTGAIDRCSCGSTGVIGAGLTGAGLTCGFSAAFGFSLGLSLDLPLGLFFCFFSVSTPNGKITGTYFLLVMPSGIPLLLYLEI